MDRERKIEIIKQALNAESHAMNEYIRSPPNNGFEKTKEVNELRKERHTLIKDFFPTRCPEPLHRAISLMKEENILESELIKAIGNSDSNDRGQSQKETQQIREKLNEAKRLRDVAIDNAEKCGVTTESDENRCYHCEAKKMDKETMDRLKRLSATVRDHIPHSDRDREKEENRDKNRGRSREKTTHRRKISRDDEHSWDDILYGLLG